MFELLLAKNIGGANPGPTFIAPIIERLEAGDVELDEVGVIADEWRRRRDAGDKAQGGFRQLFYEGKAWARTQREYLGRSLDRRDHARARARRGSKLRNTELWDEYEAGLGEGERGKT